MRIGIFDSGIGGEAVAQTVKSNFPSAEIVVVNDKKNVPYGDKTSNEIISLTDKALQPLFNMGCDLIIIACNTATTAAIDTLRTKYPEQNFIGIEPMVKVASELTKSSIITVCATPATLSSEKYKKLLKTHAQGKTIIEPDCSNWAQMIENNAINSESIVNTINNVCERGSDVIVLACTHYYWIKDLIVDTAKGRAIIIEPSEAINKQVEIILNLG